jgi:hypothetical protein
MPILKVHKVLHLKKSGNHPPNIVENIFFFLDLP